MGTLEEKKGIQRVSNIGIVLAFVFIGLMVMTRATMPMAGMVCLLGSFVSWMIGLCFYAKSKGYSPVIGLIGILGLIGLLILLVLRDQWQFEEGSMATPLPGDPKAKVAVRQYRW